MKKKILIAGQDGMVGSAIYNLLIKKKNFFVLNCRRKDLDFTNQYDVNKWFKKYKPEIVINAAGKVGGILDNSSYLSDYIYINSLIGMNIINSSYNHNVKKLINLGSACIYPRDVKQPIKEEYLLKSHLEKTNEGYAIAKIASLKYCEYLRKKFKKDFISLQPTNLYGANDNFDLKSSHVLPALIKKFHLAKIKKKNVVEVWGTGKVEREFLNVEDLAEAIFFCITKKIPYSYINVGSGDFISIRKLALMIKKISKFQGKILFNKKYPDGVLKRRLDSTKINNLGWKRSISLHKGVKDYYNYFQSIYNSNGK